MEELIEKAKNNDKQAFIELVNSIKYNKRKIS